MKESGEDGVVESKKDKGMSVEVVEQAEVASVPAAPLTGKALFKNLQTREFVGHKKKVRDLSSAFWMGTLVGLER